MPRLVPYVLGTLLALLLIGGPISYGVYRSTHFRNLHVVRAGVLYRSGQLTRFGLQRVLRDHGIKTVVTLRDAANPNLPPPDLAEENYCRAQEINYVRITPRNWWAPDGSIPAEQGVRQFRTVMDDPRNYPVLVHCFAGIHRTGAYCAIYRMEYEQWSHAQAVAEMRAHGYREVDDEWDLMTYLEEYVPRWQGKEQSPSGTGRVRSE